MQLHLERLSIDIENRINRIKLNLEELGQKQWQDTQLLQTEKDEVNQILKSFEVKFKHIDYKESAFETDLEQVEQTLATLKLTIENMSKYTSRRTKGNSTHSL